MMLRFARNISHIYRFPIERSTNIAIATESSIHSYSSLCDDVSLISDLFSKIDKNFTSAILLEPSHNFVASLLGLVFSGNSAVPLSSAYPVDDLDYFVKNTGSSLILNDLSHLKIGKSLSKLSKLHLVTHLGPKYFKVEPKDISIKHDPREASIILHTSGTTGRPKSVLIPMDRVVNSMRMMVNDWRWSKDDVILHTLPLNHVHGLFKALLAPIYAGASVLMLPKFDSEKVWKSLLFGFGASKIKSTVFTAVPTMYVRLIQYYDSHISSELSQEKVSEKLKHMRLMMSGSAALPVPAFERWEELTGHRILERHGMTELGMTISNSYEPVTDRVPGTIGLPMTGVEVCLVDSNSGERLLSADHDFVSLHVQGSEPVTGDIIVRSPSMFKEYINKSDETKASFTHDGYFKTGDTGMFKDGRFSILGRTSVDIIKVGGFKVSAIEIEDVLLRHPSIQEVAIIGLDDPVYGQRIFALIVQPSGSDPLSIEALRDWSTTRLAKHKIPTEMKLLDSMPRNALGKVNKKEFIKLYN